MRDYDSGNKLYELRKKHNLTQEELAYKLKISDKAISKWENGSSKPSISNLKKLSEIYDMSIDKILLKDKEPKITYLEVPDNIRRCSQESFRFFYTKMEDEERQGTINDIENLVEDSYESMYKDLAKEYERQREEIQEMLQDILQLECEEILKEMNTIISEKMKKIDNIVKKYK